MIVRNPTVTPDRPLIELRNVSKRFKMHREQQRSLQDLFIRFFRRRKKERQSFWPLQDVSFTVEAGDSFGIIGPNGSGKSTLLKLITGILDPTSGEMVVNGRVSSLLELGAGFHPDLTGRENIFLNGSIYGLSRRQMNERLDDIIEFAELGNFIDIPVKHYSSGMYVRLGFAVAIHTDPDLLLVDEVLAVGDESFQKKCLDSIHRFRMEGGTLLLVSHDLGTIQSLCNRAIWFEQGKIQAEGHPTDVVMEYLNQVAKREEAKSTTIDPADIADKQRWGNRRVEITGVEFCDEKGEARSVFVTGGTMELRIHYRAQERIEDPVFGLAIHHKNGAHVCGPNTDFSGLQIPHVEGEGWISYRIPSLPLLEGGYTVSVTAINRLNTEVYDFHDRVYSFRIYPGQTREQYGLVTLDGDWNVGPNGQMVEVPAAGLLAVATD